MANEAPVIGLGPAGSLTWHYLHDQTTREVFSGGSAGPGKTFTGCLFALEQCLRYPGISIGIFRETYKDVRESALATMQKVLEATDGQFVRGTHYRFSSSEGTMKFYTGSQCVFDYLAFDPGDPDYRRLGGREFTHAFVDEGDQAEERGVLMLASRLGRMKNTEYCHVCAAPGMAKLSPAIDCDDDGNPTLWACHACGAATKGIVPKLLVTGNPGPFWTRDRYICDASGKPVQLPEQRKAVTMLLTDNPNKAHVTTYRQQLEENLSDDYDRERLIGGNWMALRRTGREFLHAFRSVEHVRRVAYNANEPLHITFDFNTAPYMTLLVAQIHLQADGRWHVAFLQEICLKHPESTTEASCKALLREMDEGKYRGHDRGLFYYGDASGKNRNAQATDGMFHNYDVVERVLAKHRSNHWDRVIHRNPSHTIVRDFQNSALRGERKFYVTFDPSMTNTIADHLNVKEAADGGILKVMEKDQGTGVRSEKYGHCLQASYYLTVGAFPDEFATFIRR